MRTGKKLQVPGNYYARTAHGMGSGSPRHSGYGPYRQLARTLPHSLREVGKPVSIVECTGASVMPAKWSGKDERQYEHIKRSARQRGRSLERAREIAARTVNKQRRKEGRTPRRTSQGTGNPRVRLELPMTSSHKLTLISHIALV